MLHAERRRLKQLAEAEAKGKNLWTSKFENPVRVKIALALKAAIGNASLAEMVMTVAHEELARALGQYRLSPKFSDPSRPADVLAYIHDCPDDMMPSVIEALIGGLERAGREYPFAVSVRSFTDDVKAILDQHRISWDLVEGQMIERRSQELHAAVVEPVLYLLTGRPDWAPVERAYQQALQKVAVGEPENAITDAGTALQEMLRACGGKGNSIGDLAADARRKGLLAPHDTRLAAGIQNIMEWVGADRSERGDSHKAGTPSKDDAWFTIHVVGALIVRLGATEKR